MTSHTTDVIQLPGVIEEFPVKKVTLDGPYLGVMYWDTVCGTFVSSILLQTSTDGEREKKKKNVEIIDTNKPKC